MKTLDPAASRSRPTPRHAGRVCLAALVLILVAWTLSPAIPQDQGYHRFADQRQWLAIPHAADVLSNLAFALVGIAGIAGLLSRRRARFAPATELSLWFITVGIIGTAIGSAWYHHDPTDATLVWDRLPMAIVFGGVLGAAISQRLGTDVGGWALAILTPLGIASVVYWNLSGDLSLYLIVQLGGIAALALLLVLAPDSDDPIPWRWVVFCYVVAKLAEFADAAIWEATDGVIAGHTLKHLLAAAAVAAALWPLRSRR